MCRAYPPTWCFSANMGPSWPTFYWVFGDCVAHVSLRGSFMIELLYFTSQARWAAKRSWDSGAGSGSSPDRPARSHSGTTHRTPDDDLPARKAARAVSSTTQDESSPVGTSAAVSVAQNSAPVAPVMCPFLSGQRRLSLAVSLPLPRFATQDVAPDTAHSIATQLCPSSPASRSSTPCFDLADFDSECYRAAMSSSPVSDVVPVAPVDLLSETSWFVPVEVVEWGVVKSSELCSDMSTITSRFSPLKPPGSPVSMESVDQVVVESPVATGYIPGRRPVGDM